MALKFLNSGYFAGKVGIGVEAPLTNLDILGTTDTYLTIRNTGGGFKSGIRMYGGTAGISNIWHDDTEGNPPGIHFGTSANIATTPTTQLYIKGSNGNVGIGTTSPDQSNLVVSPPAQSADVDGITVVYNPDGATNRVRAQLKIDDFSGVLELTSSADTIATYITAGGDSYFNAGNVGIGTTSPAFKLDVEGTLGVSDLPFNTDSVSVLVADETIGADLVTNGDFATDTDWTKGTGTTISGGAANFSSADAVSLYQNIGTQTGYVKVEFTVTSYTSGILNVYSGSNQSVGNVNVSANALGTYSVIVYRTGGNSNIIFGSSNVSNFTGSIDNVSVKQITSASNQIQKRELGTGAFGPTPVGAYLPLAGGTMTGSIKNGDGVYSYWGAGDDLQIGHDGGNSYIIDRGVGDLLLYYSDDFVVSKFGTSEISIRANQDSSVELFFDNSEKLTTTSTGVTVTGGWVTSGVSVAQANVEHIDNAKAMFGNGNDLQIYHNGSNSYIDNNTGDLTIDSGVHLLARTAAGESLANFYANGANELFYDNSKKLETTSTGVTVTGDIQIDSALLSNQENTDVDTGAETVANVAIATYTAAFFDFVVKKGTNVRSGTVYACHDGTNVEFTETSTNDLGDTSDVTLSVDISGTNMRLLATVTSDDWSVKSLIRAI